MKHHKKHEMSLLMAEVMGSPVVLIQTKPNRTGCDLEEMVGNMTRLIQQLQLTNIKNVDHVTPFLLYSAVDFYLSGYIYYV